MTDKPAGLVVFDLDGTLIRGRTSCEVLAESLGRLDRMSEFEPLKTEPDLIGARQEMTRWYAAKPLKDLASSLAAARLAPNIYEGIDLLRRHRIEVAIASVTWRFAVAWFAEKLGINYFIGTDLSADGQTIHVWPRDKAAYVNALRQSLELDSSRVAAVGDSAGDIDMLQAVEHGVYVGLDLPINLARVKHVPQGDILTIAQWIVGRLN